MGRDMMGGSSAGVAGGVEGMDPEWKEEATGVERVGGTGVSRPPPPPQKGVRCTGMGGRKQTHRRTRGRMSSF